MTNPDRIMWVIDRDYLNETWGGGDSRVGYGMTLTDAAGSLTQVFARTINMTEDLTVNMIDADKRIRFKLIDDDGEVHYGGACHVAALFGDFEDDLDPGYMIEKFGEADSGAIHALFKREDVAKFKPEFAMRHRDFTGHRGWFAIYG